MYSALGPSGCWKVSRLGGLPIGDSGLVVDTGGMWMVECRIGMKSLLASAWAIHRRRQLRQHTLHSAAVTSTNPMIARVPARVPPWNSMMCRPPVSTEDCGWSYTLGEAAPVVEAACWPLDWVAPMFFSLEL